MTREYVVAEVYSEINRVLALGNNVSPVYPIAREAPAIAGDLASYDVRKAIQLDSKNAEAYLWLGLSLRKENKEAEARQAFTKSLELNPNRFWTRQQRSEERRVGKEGRS